MRSLSRFVITLPVLLLPLVSGGLRPALATEVLGPGDAARHLASAQAVDAKCHLLDQASEDELSDYVAMAEIAAAGQIGSEQAAAAIETGQDAGVAMACDATSAELARSALEAARIAFRGDGPGLRGQVADAAPEDDIVKPVSKQKARERVAATLPVADEPQPARNADRKGLDEYRRIAAAYYVEYRCRHLRQADTMRFWKTVATYHQAALDRFGRDEVARAKASAEAMASQQGRCGARTQRLVTASYAGVRRF